MAFTLNVYPFHSANTDDPDVYHEYYDCPPSMLIVRRLAGTGGYRMCERCKYRR